jgi:hypothetical protein
MEAASLVHPVEHPVNKSTHEVAFSDLQDAFREFTQLHALS